MIFVAVVELVGEVEGRRLVTKDETSGEVEDFVDGDQVVELSVLGVLFCFCFFCFLFCR